MLSSKVNACYVRNDLERVCQGDILRDFTVFEWAKNIEDELIVTERWLPYAVVLTQDCDLEQDFKNRNDKNRQTEDKHLPSLLLCPAYGADAVKEGQHMSELQLRMERYDGKRWPNVKRNNIGRYHFLPEHSDFQIPDLVLDFKQYFTVPRDVIYQSIASHYIGTVAELFREYLSIRFAQYLSRIGLPELTSAQPP